MPLVLSDSTSQSLATGGRRHAGVWILVKSENHHQWESMHLQEQHKGSELQAEKKNFIPECQVNGAVRASTRTVLEGAIPMGNRVSERPTRLLSLKTKNI